jgi:hypothetical protein
MLARFVQPANALSPIRVTLSGIIMLLIVVLFINPPAAILVTGKPLWEGGIIISVALAVLL